MDEEFDAEQVFADEIEPLIDQIMAICKRERLAFVASVCISADADEHRNRTFEIRPHGRRVWEFEQASVVIREEGETVQL